MGGRYWVICRCASQANGWRCVVACGVGAGAAVIAIMAPRWRTGDDLTVPFSRRLPCAGLSGSRLPGVYGAACGALKPLDCATVVRGINLRYRCSSVAFILMRWRGVDWAAAYSAAAYDRGHGPVNAS